MGEHFRIVTNSGEIKAIYDKLFITNVYSVPLPIHGVRLAHLAL